MHVRTLILGALLAAGLSISTVASAAIKADTEAAHANIAAVRLNADKPVATQFRDVVGKIVELEGVVHGVLPTSNTPGFLLRIGEKEILGVSLSGSMPELVVGTRLRVLALVPGNGAMLRGEQVWILGADGKEQTLLKPSPKPAKAPSNTASMRPFHVGSASQSAQSYARKIMQVNKRLKQADALRIAENVLQKSKRYGVDVALVFALIAHESGFNPRAVSRVGARGLGQLMPGTAAHLGIKDAFNIEQNIDGTIRYLADQLRRFHGNVTYALAAYNAGPGNVTRYQGVPPFRETQKYVRVVSTGYQRYLEGVL